MIELAFNHKIGLSLDSPILIGSGYVGHGPPYRHLLDISTFGALVTPPITLRPHRSNSLSRMVEVPGGVLFNRGPQNPGVKKVIREQEKVWRGLPIPVIPHLPADAPNDLMRTARALEGATPLAGIELGLPPEPYPEDVFDAIRAIQEGCMLPILVKLPLGATSTVIDAAQQAEADTLVVGTPPLGTTQHPNGSLVTGHFFGRTLHSLAVHDVRRIAKITSLPIVAAGGIHSAQDVEMFLSVGAEAVQLDTLIWTNPRQAQQIAEHFATG